MIHRPVLALSDWLRDPNTGPNAHLPNLTLEDEDAGLQLEPIKVVLDPFRDQEALEDQEPRKLPAMIVTPASPVEVAGEVNQNEQDSAGMDLLIRLVQGDVRKPAALRENAYYMDAINRSVSGFFADTAEGQAARQRGGVQMIACESRSYALAYEALGRAKVVGQMLIRVTTRDTEATS